MDWPSLESAVRIVLLAACLEEGDATGNDILEMQRILEGAGNSVSIMVPENRSRNLTIKPQLDLLKKADCIIYHLSIHWAEAQVLLRQASRPVVLRYHNITPGDFFRPYRPDLGHLCDQGRESLGELLDLSIAVLANSNFSAGKLRDLVPVERTFVLPPLQAMDALIKEPPAEHVLKSLSVYPDKVATFLSVGRVVPNKNHVLMIEAFAHYVARYPLARLIIAGKLDPSLKLYLNELREWVRKFHLKDQVVFTGALKRSELKAYYCSADALLALSLHEGFCVPPVEAMSMMVPVISSARTALAETAQFALVPPVLDAATVAASMEAIQRPELRGPLVAAAFENYIMNFTGEKLEGRMREVWSRVLALI